MRAHEGEKRERLKKHDREISRKISERCYYCHRGFGIGYQAKTRDHIIATSRGGADVPVNKSDCCLSCNNMKDDLLPQELYDILSEYLKTENPEGVPKAALRRSRMALQTICDSLLISIKKVSIMKEQMLVPELKEPLPRIRGLRQGLYTIDDDPGYSARNQIAIEAIGKEMEQEREIKKQRVMEIPTKEKITIDYTLPAPLYGVGWVVYRPYKEGERYYIDKTIIHNRSVVDDVLVQQEQGEWEMAEQPTRRITYCVKGCTYPVFEEHLFKTEDDARNWITKKYFEIQVKVA